MNQKGFINILLPIAVLVFVAIGAGIYFYSDKSTNENIVQSNPEETTNWKTYRNEKYGFEFEYPSKWSALESPHSTASLRLDFIKEDGEEGSVPFELWFWDKDYKVKDPGGATRSEKGLTILDTRGNNLQKTTYYWDKSDNIVVYLNIKTASGATGWGRWIYNQKNREKTNDYQHILSTFKFIE